MVSRKGFEPLTYGLGNRCSILLSYRECRASGEAATEDGRFPRSRSHSMFRAGVQQEGRGEPMIEIGRPGRGRRRRGGLAGGVLGLVAVFGAAASGVACDAAAGGESVWVERVARGDEVVLIDGRRLRLAGVEAPRLPLVVGAGVAIDVETEAAAGRAALADLVEGRETTFVEIETDRHGRRVGHLYDTESGQWIQEMLVAAGRARVVPRHDGRDCADRLLAAEATARGARRGLWATASHGVVPARAADLMPLVGRYVVTEGRVLSIGRSGGHIWLNFGQDFRRDFAVVMKDKDVDRFRANGFDALAAKGARVRVRGVVVHRDGPRIAIEGPEDIERVTK